MLKIFWTKGTWDSTYFAGHVFVMVVHQLNLAYSFQVIDILLLFFRYGCPANSLYNVCYGRMLSVFVG